MSRNCKSVKFSRKCSLKILLNEEILFGTVPTVCSNAMHGPHGTLTQEFHTHAKIEVISLFLYYMRRGLRKNFCEATLRLGAGFYSGTRRVPCSCGSGHVREWGYHGGLQEVFKCSGSCRWERIINRIATTPLTPRRPKCLRTRPPWRPSWKHIIFSKSYEKIINRTHHNSSGSLKASLFAYNVREESTLSWPLYRFSVQNSAGSWNFFSSSSSSLYHFMKIKNLAFLSVRERNS